jgi:RNA polymerase sigma-70 factor (ECF subfamily)
MRKMTDWQDVVRRHSGLVWRTAYRLLGRHDEAADCFQEAFLAAWEISKSQPVRHWPGLLVRLATRRALDRLRRRLRQAGQVQDLPDWSSVASREPTPQEHLAGSELAEKLRLAVGELPDHQAEVFCMRCLEELSYRDIARQLGLKVSAVSVLLHRARGRLRELLQQAVRNERAEVEP